MKWLKSFVVLLSELRRRMLDQIIRSITKKNPYHFDYGIEKAVEAAAA